MNKSQKLVIVCVGIVVMAMLLYPPFVVNGENGLQAYAGFRFIFQPFNGPTTYYELPNVNVPQLLAQWAGSVVIGACFWLYFKE